MTQVRTEGETDLFSSWKSHGTEGADNNEMNVMHEANNKEISYEKQKNR